MKNKGLIITLIVFLSAAIIALSVFTYKMIKNDISFNISFGKIFDNAYKDLVVDEEFDQLFNNFGITVNASDVEIKKSTNGKVSLKVYADKEYTNVDTTDESLTINISEKTCKGFCVFNKISKVELYVPEELENNFVIDSKYGDIDIEGFLNSVFNIKSDAGDIEIGSAKELDIHANYGDINIGSVITAKIVASVGDIKIGTVDNLIIDANTGDVKIDSINAKLDIKCDIGDIKIGSINLIESSNIENNTGDIKIGGTNDIYVDASTKIGETKVNSKDRKSEIVLTIKNKIGDIKVNY